MRTVADGVRLLLTAYVLAAVFPSFGVAGAVVGLGLVMIWFTLVGGIEAVVWIEVAQLLIYVGGAVAVLVLLLGDVGFGNALAAGAAAGKLRLFDFSFDLTRNFTFWSGLIGGTFLTLSTHGTDQYLVQRYLCTDRPRSAAKALLASAVVVLVQFVLFLSIGVLLFAFYGERTPVAAADQVFPHFIAHHLPVGLSGLVVAAILAAALSSSLNAIAATVVADLMRPREDRQTLRLSRLLTVVAGLAQIGVGLAMQQSERSGINTVLGIAALVNGPILGVFLLGATKSASTRSALVGMGAGIAVVAWVALATAVAWPWYAVVGSLTTLAVGLLWARISTSFSSAAAPRAATGG
jgi:solute:Na+ symporter, SSS family